MGVYDMNDFTADVKQLMFQDTITQDTFNSLPSFPTSDTMVTGQLYKWTVPNTAVMKTGESQGGNVLRFVQV